MSRIKKIGTLVLSLTLLAIWSPDALAKKKKKKAGKAPQVATGTLDEGKLVTSWFSPDGLAFVETDEIDYFWAREGFSLDGQSFHFETWPEHEFLAEAAKERDENDHRLARQMNSDMARSFSDVLGRVFDDRAETSTSEGDILVQGRIVDCSTGNTAAKMFVGFGAGAGYTTIDLKFTDKKSGQLMAAVHHRVVSGTTWSTTDSKFFKWIKKMGEAVEEDDFGGVYRDGDPVKE